MTLGILNKHQLRNLRLCLKAGNAVFFHSSELDLNLQIDEAKADSVRFCKSERSRKRNQNWQKLAIGDVLQTSGAYSYTWNIEESKSFVPRKRGR